MAKNMSCYLKTFQGSMMCVAILLFKLIILKVMTFRKQKKEFKLQPLFAFGVGSMLK